MAIKELIQRIEVGSGGASSINFASIPQNYTDLYVLVSGRNSVDSVELRMQFNGDTSSSYSIRALYGSGSGVGSNTVSNSYFAAFGSNFSSSTANTFGNTSIYIPNYTSSNKKSISVDGTAENNATEAYCAITTGLWNNTSAITSINLLAQTGSWVQYSSASLYGIKRGQSGLSTPFGGTITTSGGYTYHAFTGSGTLEVPNLIQSAEMLIIGGGGAGGAADAGGGGAGGVCYHPGFTIPRGSYTILVGAGGAGAIEAPNMTSATDSTAFGVTAFAGGHGGSYSNTYGQAGGSGGGGQGTNNGLTSVPGASTQTSNGGATGYGNAGGAGQVQIQWIGGGGGGAGEAGNSDGHGTGGDGLNTWSTWATATSTGVSGFYAGGGAGNGEFFSGSISGGEGGGGSSGGYYSTGAAGTANTGSGGSGGGWSEGRRGGNGGSGLVIIRYLTPA